MSQVVSDSQQAKRQLRNGLSYLGLWLVVVVIEVRIFSKNGLMGIRTQLEQGAYWPVFWLTLSIVTLALAITCLARYWGLRSGGTTAD